MRIPAFISVGALVFSVVTCGPGESNPRADEAISSEAFVQAYFQLQTVGLKSPQREIDLRTRDSILSDLGLTEEDLLTFVDVWGGDGEVMVGVWQALDSLMREERSSEAEDPTGEDYEPGEDDVGPRGVGRL